MKRNLIKAILTAFMVFSIMYLACAFFNMSFDISRWSAGCRFICSCIGILGGFLAGIFTFIDLDSI